MPQDHPPYIEVYQSVGGWKPQLMTWEVFDLEEGNDGGYTPWQTGYGWATVEAACEEGRNWAETEEVKFIEPSVKFVSEDGYALRVQFSE